jgi:glycosyltransferase involved in cell wall biosynthesis
VEEFGIAAVECQAAGRPVIGRAAGGILETVREGVTGSLWTGGPDELAQAVLGFDDEAVDPQDCVRHAARFSRNAFRRGLTQQIELASTAREPRPAFAERQPLPSTRLVRRAGRDPHR